VNLVDPVHKPADAFAPFAVVLNQAIHATADPATLRIKSGLDAPELIATAGESKGVVLQHFLMSFAPGFLDCIETVLFELPPIIQGEGGCYCDLVSSFSQCRVVLFEFNGQVRAKDPVLSDRHIFTDNFPV
jgi:hypothetical protein